MLAFEVVSLVRRAPSLMVGSKDGQPKRFLYAGDLRAPELHRSLRLWFERLKRGPEQSHGWELASLASELRPFDMESRVHEAAEVLDGDDVDAVDTFRRLVEAKKSSSACATLLVAKLTPTKGKTLELMTGLVFDAIDGAEMLRRPGLFWLLIDVQRYDVASWRDVSHLPAIRRHGVDPPRNLQELLKTGRYPLDTSGVTDHANAPQDHLGFPEAPYVGAGAAQDAELRARKEHDRSGEKGQVSGPDRLVALIEAESSTTVSDSGPAYRNRVRMSPVPELPRNGVAPSPKLSTGSHCGIQISNGAPERSRPIRW